MIDNILWFLSLAPSALVYNYTLACLLDVPRKKTYAALLSFLSLSFSAFCHVCPVLPERQYINTGVQLLLIFGGAFVFGRMTKRLCLLASAIITVVIFLPELAGIYFYLHLSSDPQDPSDYLALLSHPSALLFLRLFYFVLVSLLCVLTLSLYLDYALGHSIYNYMKTRMIQNTIGQSNSAIASYVYDCWKYPGDTNAKYARYFPNDGDYGNANWGRASDFNVEKADYLCLRDVSLYYDLPERWVRKLHMKKLTVGITCNTIAYWTGVTGAINPETGMGATSSSGHYTSVSTANSSSDSRPNIFPPTSKFLFNLKVTF